MILSAIVALSQNGVIGKSSDNSMPWHLPADLAYFKRITAGHHVLMGRRSFESIGKPLPGRTNMVLSATWGGIPGVTVVRDLGSAVDKARNSGEDECFVIGGARVYCLSMSQLDRLYVTHVHGMVEGDVYFPSINWCEWRLVSSSYRPADLKNRYALNFCVYERILTV